jgi:hypothetical protein
MGEQSLPSGLYEVQIRRQTVCIWLWKQPDADGLRPELLLSELCSDVPVQIKILRTPVRLVSPAEHSSDNKKTGEETEASKPKQKVTLFNGLFICLCFFYA